MAHLHPSLRTYINAATITSDSTGAWFSTEGLTLITATVVMSMGAGTITGAFYAECTANADPTPLGASRVIFPAGCLHTSLSGIALADPATSVAVTAATTGNFTVSMDAIIAGKMRFVWDFTSGSGASPNTITVYLNAR